MFSICVVFSNVFHVLGKLCDFVVYACEDTALLKFRGFVFVLCESLLSNICVWIWKPN